MAQASGEGIVMTTMDQQDKTVAKPLSQRRRQIERARAALREVEQARPGSTQEGHAIDGLRLSANRLMDLYEDAFPGTPAEG
jgi:hypothetical protein